MPNRFYKSGSTVWNNGNSWSAISSLSIDNAGIPTSADPVFFDANSGGNCAVTTTVGSCASLNTTGYSGTFLLNVDLAIIGNQVISATTIFNPLGAGFYCPNGTGSITSNGVSFPNFKLNRSNSSFTLTLNDVLNVGNILQDFNGAITNGFSVNVNGNMTMVAGVVWSGTTIYNLIGTGNFGSIAATPFFGNTININTSGTITFLANVRFSSGTLNYISGNVNTTTNSSLFDLYGNNSVTSKNVSTGNEIVFNNVRAGQLSVNGTTTLGSNMRVSGNFTVGNFNGYSFNGNTIFVSGNIINTTTVTNAGTSTMVMEGSSAATISGGIHSRSLTINKSSGAVVTLLGNLTFGQSGGNLTINTPLNFTTNNTTVTISGTNLTINNPISNAFFNLTIPAAHTLTLSGASTSILGTLLCSGSAIFAGAYGWTTQNFSCTVAGAIIRLQNIVQFTSAEYTVNGLLNLVGTLGNRLILEASGRANFTGSIAVATPPTGSTMTLSAPPSTGTIVVGMTVSQATGQIPPGLSPFINDRPTIASGVSLSWVLNKTLTTRVPTPTGTIALAAGFKAKFTLANNGTSSQNVIYVQTQDIDSSFGKAIFVTGSNGDDAATDVALFRTLNWGPLVVQSGSVYYTFVN
jgi:hypothetical protein